MIAFIDDHCGAYGVEPICRVLPIAPSTYHAHAARRADPAKVVGVGEAEWCPDARASQGVRGELRRLWRAQGLAATRPEGPQRCPRYRGTTDANAWIAGRDPWQAGANQDRRQDGAVPTTMLWPRPSTDFTRPRSFIDAGYGGRSKPSNLPTWNRSTGSKIAG